MGNKIDQKWASQLAQELLREIICQMSGIQLEGAVEVPPHFQTTRLGIVCGETLGAIQIRMKLEAEQGLFERLAENMIGAPPKDQEEVEEYATEMFNIVCGRFVSELYVYTGSSARFLPTKYEQPPGQTKLHENSVVNTVKLISDSNEGMILSWTLAS